ncbi:MAG: DUF3794 domain-containing protein [Clostridia bacterium]|nr:DUF3794 domain-containing protein [Clostridia bacterium]
MSIDYSYKDIEWCQRVFNKSEECFCDAGIIVPDSMDDIAKVLCVKALPSVTDSKCENGRVTVSGQVKITVLYIGENENGRVFTLNTTQPFSHTITSVDITEDCIPRIRALSAGVNHTFVNSRRIKLNAIIRLLVSCYRENRSKVLTKAAGAELLTAEKAFLAARSICTKSIIITDNAELGSGKAPVCNILNSHIRISDCDFKALNNKVIAKGNLSLSVLYSTSDNLSDASFTIPFTEVLEAEGVAPSLLTNVTLSVADCEIRPDTDLSGEYRMLDVNVVLTAHITSFSEEKVTAVTDLFLPGGAVNATALPITVTSAITPLCEEEFIRGSISLPPTAPSFSRILDTECNICDVTLSDSAAMGNAEVSIMYLSSDMAINTYTAKIPVTHKFAHTSLSDLWCEVKHIGYAITGDNSLEVRLSVNFHANHTAGEPLTLISDCTEEEYNPPSRPSVIVSFVNAGDSLWSIAKKHNIALSKLALANALDENSILTVGEKLIIPR